MSVRTSSPHARRVSDALQAAHRDAKCAADAAAQYRWRGNNFLHWDRHTADLFELGSVPADIQYVLRYLAVVAQHLADDVHRRYLDGVAPDGNPWPDTVGRDAEEACQELLRLRRHLRGIHVGPSESALITLNASICRAAHDCQVW